MLTAVAKTSAGTKVTDGSSRFTDFGNSSPAAYANAYFPELELISTVLLSSTVKVKGCSGNVFKISSKSFAGTATLPLLLESIDNVADIVVSRSEAETVNASLSSSNKKLSKIGNVLLLLITLPKTCNCFNKYELDTINFICFVLFFDVFFSN
ncbi:hypothetical protein D3C85_727350 [compost metagenome]